MRRTDIDEELIFTGLSIKELCSRMRDEVDTYVSNYKLDAMYDICSITMNPKTKWYWFVRENGTFLWAQDAETTGDLLRNATECFKKRRIYCIERTQAGYTLELMVNTYSNED